MCVCGGWGGGGGGGGGRERGRERGKKGESKLMAEVSDINFCI